MERLQGVIDKKRAINKKRSCGYINHDLKLSDRVFKCPVCGLKIDRDLNASINILKRGLERIAFSSGQSEYRDEMVILRQPIRRTPAF